MIGVLVNPKAGGGRALRVLRGLEEFLRARGARFRVALTQARGDEASLAAELVEEGVEVLVLVGGDGTYHHALQSRPEIPVAFVPGGRGNDLLRGLLGRVPKPREAFEWLLLRKPRKIDLGEVRLGSRRVVFVNGAGLGLDARVAWRVDGLPVGGMLPYALALARELGDLKPIRLRVSGLFEGKALLAGFGVGKFLGGGFKLFPKASPEDGLLDAYAIEALPLRRVLANLPKVVSGKHIGMPEVRYSQAPAFKARLEEPAPLQLDGELYEAQGELEFRTLPGALKILFP